MVVIIDPHLKRTTDYPIYKGASELGVLVKNKDNNEYEGWCWTGSSSWIDFFNPASWNWWIKIFRTKKASEWTWTESTESTYIWHDMNEVRCSTGAFRLFISDTDFCTTQPSVFNGPEITMPKDNIHYGGWEHRDVHNINGMLFVSTAFWQLDGSRIPSTAEYHVTGSDCSFSHIKETFHSDSCLLCRISTFWSYVDRR